MSREGSNKASAGPPGHPADLLTQALDGYADWLRRLDAAASESGISRLHDVAELCRKHCPGTSQSMTDLLLGQVKLAELLFEHQRKVARGEATEPLAKSRACTSLIEGQLRAIRSMRSVCDARRGICITGPKMNDRVAVP